MLALSDKVEIVEVGPRDGLQNEKKIVGTDDKVRLIKALVNAGLTQIEATSFVHPKWVPQLADAGELFKQISSIKGVTFSVLVPNEKGFERALDAGVKEICLFLSASASHNKNNVNMSPQESLQGFKNIISDAKNREIRVKTIIATAFACPFEGEINPKSVLEIADKLAAYDVDEIVLADTIGHAHPRQVYSMFKLIQNLLENRKQIKISAHFHDTRGMGLANVLAALQAGIVKFDASIAGLGGCPYAPGASGNIATEDLINMLHCMGIETGIDLRKLLEAAAVAAEIVGRPVQSHMFKPTCGNTD